MEVSKARGGGQMDLPMRPRARVWLPAEPSTPTVSYGFERVVLRILPTEARADGPLPPAEVEESGRATYSKMDIDPILSMDPSSVSSACSRRLESMARMMVQINLQQSKAESAHILLRLGRPYPGTVAEQQRYLWFKDKKPQAPGGKQHR